MNATAKFVLTLALALLAAIPAASQTCATPSGDPLAIEESLGGTSGAACGCGNAPAPSEGKVVFVQEDGRVRIRLGGVAAGRAEVLAIALVDAAGGEDLVGASVGAGPVRWPAEAGHLGGSGLRLAIVWQGPDGALHIEHLRAADLAAAV